MGNWIEKCKQNSFESVAGNLGINVKGGRYGPCPACNADRTGTKDARFPMGRVKGSNNPTGWRCFACAAGGDLMDLVAFSIEGCKFRETQDKTRIKEFFDIKNFESLKVKTPEKERLPEEDLNRLFQSMENRTVPAANNRHVNEYLRERFIDPKDVREAAVFCSHFNYLSLKKVYTSSGKLMPFWPYAWARDYPICVPLYDYSGKAKSFQGRAVKKLEHGRKTMCPIGFSMSGLVFACRNTVRYLRGEESFKKFWIVEGEIDFLTLKSMPDFKDICVIGIKNGSIPFFKEMKFPAAAEVVIATDNDEKGNEYAIKIAQEIYPAKPQRLDLGKYADINDARVYTVCNDNEFSINTMNIVDFPDYGNVIAKMGLRLLKHTYFKIEEASRKDRVAAITDINDHIPAIAEAFKTETSEAEKFWYRIQSLHGCGQVAKSMKTRIDLILKGYDEQTRVKDSEIFTEELEGPDPKVRVGRKPIKEKGVVIGFGEIIRNEKNLVSILHNDRRLQGRFKYNEHADMVEIDGQPITDNKVMEISIWLQEHYESFRMELTTVGRGIDYVAGQPGNTHHPVAEMLNRYYTDVDLSEAPDHARPEEIFTHYFGADLGPKKMYRELIREYSKRFCITLVKRALQPGCKADSLPVLIGPQGCGKSTGLRALACNDEFFSDTPFDVKSKDAYQMLRGVWLYEIGEAESLLRGGFRAVKGFITAQVDRYRKPYRSHVTASPRGGAFATTSNETQIEFLSDPSGSRRYHAMLVGTHHAVRVADLKNDAIYIWARAMHMFHGTGEYAEDGPNHQNWLPEEFQVLSRRLNEKFGSGDPWIQFIGGWCQQRWNEWAFQKKTTGKNNRKLLEVDVKIILSEVLSVPPHRQTKVEMKRVGDVLSQIGVSPVGQKRVGKRRINFWMIPGDFDDLEKFDISKHKTS